MSIMYTASFSALFDQSFALPKVPVDPVAQVNQVEREKTLWQNMIVRSKCEVGRKLFDVDSDFLLVTGLDVTEKLPNEEEKEFLVELMKWALFPLPNGSSGMIAVAHPKMRYCLDLRNARFDRSKSVKRFGKDFRISVNMDFLGTAQKLIQGHIDLNGSTWFTPGLLKLFVELQKDREAPIHHTAFELWEGDELVAVTMGYAIGAAFHDYSMLTFKRDRRSCGAILTKTVGHILQQCGYKLWYWGFKVSYMNEYDHPNFGGRFYDHQQFVKVWCELTNCEQYDAQAQSESIARYDSIVDFVQKGQALIQSKIK